MKTNILSILLVCFTVTSMISQKSVNNYKYVIVPAKYDFLKEKDKYQLNSLSKFLFEKYGFTSLMEGDEYPEDLNFNRCLAMKSDVIKESGMFMTKLKVILKDCNEKEIFQSAVGSSREKEYKVAYNKALREAFKSIEGLNYKYKPNDEILALGATAALVTKESEEIKQLKQQIQELEKEKETKIDSINQSSTTSSQVSAAVPAAVGIGIVAKEQPKKNATETKTSDRNASGEVLYAQEIDNGYQLVDSSPKVVYRVKKTNLDQVFLVEGKSAILFKKDNDWVVEYYENSVLKQHVLKIKF
ncbi:hypothetical protein [Cognatitamlana onchidii]|uniref:hypothetical protein n=1 Tax=Cognatitamlana onchidii TaxID=2562860 RepID=UPI0010A63B28|nr:hypothetical protein [Algibacter onchidii]